MVKITLTNGTSVEFEGINGTNFIVPDKKEMDVSVFSDENLKSGTVTLDDGTEYEFENLRFTQQQKQLNGDYYICFHELTEKEQMNEFQELLTHVASIQVENGDISLDDIPVTLADAVKAKMDADKKLEK